jgi:TolB protein
MGTRIRITLAAVVLASAGFAASPALAGAPSAQAVPMGFGQPSQIPWSSVGHAWLLAQWQAGTPRPHHPVPSYLVLVAPTGQRYIVLREDHQLATATFTAWSGDGSRALFVAQSGGATTMLIVDLRTGAISSSFVMPLPSNVNYQNAGFTRPDGLALDVLNYGSHDVLSRYSLAGQAQISYPAAFSSVGRFDGSWLSSADGTTLVMGAGHGLAIVSNDGVTSRQLVIHQASSCYPLRWWSATVVLAQCGPEPRLYEFPIHGSAPVALTRKPVPPDNGDIGAWRVGSHVYVQVASACGYVYLARLNGADPVMVHVPGVPTGHSVDVVGASQSSLALEASLACQGHPSLIWFTPASNSVKVVLGPPVTGGNIGQVFIYPPPLG